MFGSFSLTIIYAILLTFGRIRLIHTKNKIPDNCSYKEEINCKLSSQGASNPDNKEDKYYGKNQGGGRMRS